MSFFVDLRAQRLIAEIRRIADPLHPDSRQAFSKLARLGAGAIPQILDAVAVADKHETAQYVEVLTQLIDNKSFPLVATGLAEGGPRAVSALTAALGANRNYTPALLLELLGRNDIAKPVVLDLIHAQKGRFSLRELLHHAYGQQAKEKAALFRTVAELADAAALPELISRLDGKDLLARLHIIDILARFNRPEVFAAIQGQLHDPSKQIRKAALDALASMDGHVDIAALCQLLRDPDLEIANRAIDVVVRAKDPLTMKYLVEVLKDENEYARRAAVEVLNHLGTTRDIKQLLQVIKDDDWWVRTRAADALGKIGGPRVVDAVIELIGDEDEEVRRAAIEILNQTRDERAIDHLIKATGDADWWVSERAVDALAEIGSRKALPALVSLLERANARSLPTVVRALGKLGDFRNIAALTPLLQRPEKEIRIEAINAMARLADDKQADTVRSQIQHAATGTGDATLEHAALRAIEDIDTRFSGTAVAAAATASNPAPTPLTANTLLVERSGLDPLLRPTPEPSGASQPLDISLLEPGEVIDARYKFIKRIGKGAFGTVLLVEDTVVEEQLILKFLNANVAQDEEMMKRFVHELRYSRKITHRNVIRIYDFLYMRGHYAISMEYFPSHTLGNEILNEEPLPLARALQYGIDICTGMAIAHQAGIVHRDLKPANILINDEGLLKIVDFGVAAAQAEGDTQLTKTGYVIGSPKYMAPEQILGKKVDARADIYSIGVILYEMLTGQPPYSRGDHMSVMYQHVQGKAKSAIEVNPQLPLALSELVTRAMAVDKTLRFQSMDELRHALEQALATLRH